SRHRIDPADSHVPKPHTDSPGTPAPTPPSHAETGTLNQRRPRSAARPGLSLLATDDPYVGSDELRRRAADRAGARTEVLDQLGHWWMLQDPARGAAALTRFWDAID
ncbi:MAG: hypothetical protein ACLP9N_22830, partial [Mycobacterium sp.]